MLAPEFTIAVVDDDDGVRRALGRLLRSLACEPVLFASGEAFLESLASSQPDCVVLDLHMSNLTGMDVMAELQVRGVAVPTIILTGHDETGMRKRCLGAGAVGFLTKPVQRASLSAALESVSLI